IGDPGRDRGTRDHPGAALARGGTDRPRQAPGHHGRHDLDGLAGVDRVSAEETPVGARARVHRLGAGIVPPRQLAGVPVAEPCSGGLDGRDAGPRSQHGKRVAASCVRLPDASRGLQAYDASSIAYPARQLRRRASMDAFSYLSVLISIILGLAVTQVLQGFRGLMLARSRVRLYWPALVWAVLVLVICVQAWWAMFGLSQRPAARWTFFDFGMVLLQTVPLYLMAGLVLPDIDIERGLDLRE